MADDSSRAIVKPSATDGGDGRKRPPRKEERIRYLIRLLATGNYYSRATCLALGEEWNLDWRTVKNDACEAARRLRFDPAELEAERQKLAQFCEQMRGKAANERNLQTGLSDVRAALEAAQLEARFKGIELDEPLQGENLALRIVVVAEPETPPPAEKASA